MGLICDFSWAMECLRPRFTSPKLYGLNLKQNCPDGQSGFRIGTMRNSHIARLGPGLELERYRLIRRVVRVHPQGSGNATAEPLISGIMIKACMPVLLDIEAG
jgi:hypothetical protein